MPDILLFSRMRSTYVEQGKENQLRAVCQLHDTLTEATVEVLIKTPELEIVDTRATLVRTPWSPTEGEAERISEVKGLRIGPGMKKIIRGVMGDTPQIKQLAFMVEECCNAVILCFTKDVLLKAPKDKRGEREFYAQMVKENFRLYNRCAAYAPGSSLVEGIKAPQ